MFVATEGLCWEKTCLRKSGVPIIFPRPSFLHGIIYNHCAHGDSIVLVFVCWICKFLLDYTISESDVLMRAPNLNAGCHADGVLPILTFFKKQNCQYFAV